MKKTKSRIRLTKEVERAARILEEAHSGANHDGWMDCKCPTATAIRALRLRPELPHGYGELRVRMPQSTLSWLEAFAYPQSVDEVLPGLLREAMMAGRTKAQQAMTEKLHQKWKEAIAPDAPDEIAPPTHVLYGGFAMCGFTRKAPQCWPVGHAWVTLDTFERQMYETQTQVTCAPCIDAARAKLEQR